MDFGDALKNNVNHSYVTIDFPNKLHTYFD